VPALFWNQEFPWQPASCFTNPALSSGLGVPLPPNTIPFYLLPSNPINLITLSPFLQNYRVNVTSYGSAVAWYYRRVSLFAFFLSTSLKHRTAFGLKMNTQTIWQTMIVFLADINYRLHRMSVLLDWFSVTISLSPKNPRDAGALQ
jgi:hypothetical protein